MNIEDIITIVQAALHSSVFVKYGFVGLFASSVISATAVPFPSELTAFALVGAGNEKWLVSIILAAGWTAGGTFGYFIGKSGNKLFHKLRKKPDKKEEEQQSKMEALLSKYGWIAIFGSSWIPFAGDFIPIVAGTKKYDIRRFILALVAGKAVKALAVVYFGSFFLGRLFG